MSIYSRICANAKRCPDSQSVVDVTGSITYSDLVARVESLARDMIDRGVQPGSRIGIRILTGIDYIVCLLACFRNSLTAIPLCPELTDKRLFQMAEQAGLNYIFTDYCILELVSDYNVSHNSYGICQGGAYLLFTSGCSASTILAGLATITMAG